MGRVLGRAVCILFSGWRCDRVTNKGWGYRDTHVWLVNVLRVMTVCRSFLKIRSRKSVVSTYLRQLRADAENLYVYPWYYSGMSTSTPNFSQIFCVRYKRNPHVLQRNSILRMGYSSLSHNTPKSPARWTSHALSLNNTRVYDEYSLDLVLIKVLIHQKNKIYLLVISVHNLSVDITSIVSQSSCRINNISFQLYSLRKQYSGPFSK